MTHQYTIKTGDLLPETAIALLADLPFHAFEDEEQGLLKAYIQASEDSISVQAAFGQLAERFDWHFEKEVLAEENWNAIWESNYQPVEIGNFLRIHAPFHPPADGFTYQLELVPEMSFGTGHHATTFLMSEMMRDYLGADQSWWRESDRRVFDFGTGTGLLGLLSRKLGAEFVSANDHDERCIRSAEENALRNGLHFDELSIGDEDNLPAGPFDLIVANINRHVLEASLESLAKRLNSLGQIWLSGILEDDLSIIDGCAERSGLTRLEVRQREGWLACRYVHKA